MSNMRYSTYRVSLDLQKHQSQVSIAVFQYDTAVRLCISLTDGGNPYTIPIEDGYRAIFYGKRPDNTPLCHNCVIESDSRIIYDFKDSTAAVRGITNCQLRLYGGDGELITAPRFIIVVDERVVSEGLIELDDDQLSAIDAIFSGENERVKAELGRVEAELGRVEAEEERIKSEEERATSFTNLTNDILAAENARANAEKARVNAEKARVTAENAREEAEKARGANFVVKEPEDGLDTTQTVNSNFKVNGAFESTKGSFNSLYASGMSVATEVYVASYVDEQLGDIADRLNQINNGGGTE